VRSISMPGCSAWWSARLRRRPPGCHWKERS